MGLKATSIKKGMYYLCFIILQPEAAAFNYLSLRLLIAQLMVATIRFAL